MWFIAGRVKGPRPSQVDKTALITDDQREIVAFLSDGANYGRPGTIVERIETHISIIFLVEEQAYKLKRAVRFSYLDYSTTALREQYCRAELALNRRTAPTLYRRLRAITQESDGSLVFDGTGTVVDWVVEMQRFSQGDLFDRLAAAGKLTPALMFDLTDAIAAFHRAAEITPGYGGRVGIADTIAGNNINLIAACPPLDRGQVDGLYAASKAKLATVGVLLERRRASGKVRRCHGDLHLRNVCLVNGRPMPFDCIEFNDALSCIDVLYDLAFLLMDLVQRGLRNLASVVFNRYLDLTGDMKGLPAIPLFMSIRAEIRAHVMVTQAWQTPSMKTLDEARSYLSLAGTVLRPHQPSLIAIGGPSGAGKSKVAQALASDFPVVPGARVIRSDVLRKRLFEVAPETRLPSSAYGKETMERVYRGLRDEASVALAAGYTVIADATFLRQEERKSIAALAERAGVAFVGLWLEAPNEVLATRLDARRHDASDADTTVLRQQLEFDTGGISWRRIDTRADLRATLATARGAIDTDICRPPLASV
jgi:aminoglycoside phosphotransferase family enzyme/predicted kinase